MQYMYPHMYYICVYRLYSNTHTHTPTFVTSQNSQRWEQIDEPEEVTPVPSEPTRLGVDVVGVSIAMGCPHSWMVNGWLISWKIPNIMDNPN